MIDVRHLFPIDNVSWRKRDVAGRIQHIAVHHTAGFYVRPGATQDEELNHLRMIDQYHRSIGFGGIGYHIVVFSSGRIYWVSDFGIWGANVQGMNHVVLGICAVGYFDDYIPQAPQLDGMAEGIIEMWEYAA